MTTETTALRPELEELPERLKRLPVYRGFPVPWFVEWVVDEHGHPTPMPIGQGTPDFRIMSLDRLMAAVKRELCWVCGERLGSFKAFVIGPMCAVNRTNAEPPAHRECAEWSARNCPFLARPHMRRRDAGMPEEVDESPGLMLKRNPGVAAVWVTRRYKLKVAPSTVHLGGSERGILFDIGEPETVSWWCEGRPAARSEVEASISSGLPELRELAVLDGPRGLAALDRQVAAARELLPAPSV